MKTNLVVSGLVMLTLGVSATYGAPHAFAGWLIDRSGTLIQVNGMILGDDITDDPEENESEDSVAQKRIELIRENTKQKEEITREKLKQQTELKIKQNEKRVESLKTQAKYELKNESGKLEIKGEIKDKNGNMVRTQNQKVEEGEPIFVEQENEDGKIEQVRINAVKDGKIEMLKNRLRTTSDYELQVGDKNEISVTLPNGKTREVALPDKALENLVSQGVIAAVTDSEDQGDYELVAGSNGEPVYQVEGQVEKKLLGFLKLKFDQKIEVAASASDDGTTTTGDVVSSQSRETNPWRRFLERLSR
jgi:hypothetical protein